MLVLQKDKNKQAKNQTQKEINNFIIYHKF